MLRHGQIFPTRFSLQVKWIWFLSFLNPAPPSLVSYAIDEDDDDPTVLSDDGGSDTEGSHPKRSEKAERTEETILDLVMDTSASPVTTEDFPFINLDEPPTILSSEHQIGKEPIHVFSQDHLQSLPVSSEMVSGQEVEAQPELGEERKISSALEDVQLPPEPTGLCRMELQEKVDREVRRMRLDIGYDPNRAIQDNKAFRNPRFVGYQIRTNPFIQHIRKINFFP